MPIWDIKFSKHKESSQIQTKSSINVLAEAMTLIQSLSVNTLEGVLLGNLPRNLQVAPLLRAPPSALDVADNDYSDGNGHTIYCCGALESDERQAIFDYVTKMELALRINKALHSGNVSSDSKLGATIAKAIQRCGIRVKFSVKLWRKAGLHNDLRNEVLPELYEQKTIISTTDDENISENWSGDYLYQITVAPQHPFILVRHKLTNQIFDEYLLGPGFFLYDESARNPKYGSTIGVIYATGKNAKEDTVNTYKK